jgi:hypothetical protein
MFTPTHDEGRKIMSMIDTLGSLRAGFERMAALALYIATAVTVAGGAVAMCLH